MIRDFLKPIRDMFSEIGETIFDIKTEVVDFLRDIRFGWKTVVVFIGIWAVTDILFKLLILIIMVANFT